ncbi:MAG: hypothetical protein OQK77_02875 [Psychromonas sp.]|nr:hypothetical protein [Psychromonas sp.]
MKRLKKSVIKWIVVALLCLFSGFLLGKFKIDILQESLALMKVDLQTVNAEKVELSQKVAALETDQITDKQTIKRLTEENKKLNEQLSDLENKLYFYERVVAPELHTSGVQIYSFSVYKSSETALWNYKLVLMQAQKGRRFLKGQFELDFSVLKNQHRKNVSIRKFSEAFNPAFQFKYFQTIEGAFTLPPEIQLEEVVVKLNVPGNRWYKRQQLEQRYKWEALINKEDNNLSELTVDKLPELRAKHINAN